MWGSKHGVPPPSRRGHHAVLPTKTSPHCIQFTESSIVFLNAGSHVSDTSFVNFVSFSDFRCGYLIHEPFVDRVVPSCSYFSFMERWYFRLFPQCWLPGVHYFHVLSFLLVFVMVSLLVVNSLLFATFPDCFLCFTHVMGTFVQFTLLLCYIGSFMFPGGVGTCIFVTPCPVCTVGKSRLVVVAVQGAPLARVSIIRQFEERAIRFSISPLACQCMLLK